MVYEHPGRIVVGWPRAATSNGNDLSGKRSSSRLMIGDRKLENCSRYSHNKAREAPFGGAGQEFPEFPATKSFATGNLEDISRRVDFSSSGVLASDF